MDYEISFKDNSVTITASGRRTDTHYEGFYIRWMLCRWFCCVAVWYLLCSFNRI